MLTLVQPFTARRTESCAMHVVIVDDQQSTRTILRHIVDGLSPDLNVVDFETPAQALCWSKDNHVDLLLLGYQMCGMNGLEFVRHFRLLPMHSDVPIVLISETGEEPFRHAAFDAGAIEFLVNPVRPRELASRCKNLLLLRKGVESAKQRTGSLERQVSEAVRKVDEREREILLRLATASQFRDRGTGLHSMRVACFAGLIARKLGIGNEDAHIIEVAAPLHDVGKIGIPDSILHKTTELSEAEWVVMRRHSQIGHEILRNSQSPLVQLGSTIALCHHERWDGAGYPHGLVGVDIPLAARIVAVADVFDALLSERPHKPAWTHERAVEYVVHNRGSQFDPACVDSLLCDMRLVRELGSGQESSQMIGE